MSPNKRSFSISGHLFDVHSGQLFPARISVHNGYITAIDTLPRSSVDEQYITIILGDAHLHTESSSLSVSRAGYVDVRNGCGFSVSDPHEIVNVDGWRALRWMLDDAGKTPFMWFPGVPSCVPASNASIETAGAKFDLSDVRKALRSGEFYALSEVMNWPAVLARQDPYMSMIAEARSLGIPVDGHFPGGLGTDLFNYAAAGISSDHECSTTAEGADRIAAGMLLQIRNGSAAKNYDPLKPFIGTHPKQVAFCCDDLHSHELRRGHINDLCARAVGDGFELQAVLRAGGLNAIEHYKLPVGQLRVGDPADFVVWKDLESFEARQTYIKGELVYDHGQTFMPLPELSIINHFHAQPIATESLALRAEGEVIRCIEIEDGQLKTKERPFQMTPVNGFLESDPSRDILKLAVLNRYAKRAAPALGFVHGMGLKQGAIASSVAHDCHNVVACGVSDEEIAAAINLIVEHRGGIAVVHGDTREILPLPIAGLISDLDGDTVGLRYEELLAIASALGSTLHDVLMMLSFLALPVIPSLKMTDKGVFDGIRFEHVSVFV